MALNVEDGTVVADADAYVSVADCGEYATARGLSFAVTPEGDAEAAIRRATDALDALYRSRLPGSKLDGRGQSLEWPRAGARDASGDEIAEDEVPTEWVRACCEMAVRERATPGSTMPDLERGGRIKSIRAGSVGVDYGSDASPYTTFTLIDGILSSLLGGGASDDSFVGVAVRT